MADPVPESHTGPSPDWVEPGWTVRVELQLAHRVDHVVAAAIEDAIRGELGGAVTAALAEGDLVRATMCLVRTRADHRASATDAMAAALDDVWDVVADRARVDRVRCVEVIADDVADEKTISEPVPPLVAEEDVATMLAIPHSELRTVRLSTPGFPVPVARTGAGAVWTRASVLAFRRQQEGLDRDRADQPATTRVV